MRKGLQTSTKLLQTSFYQFLIALYSAHICTMKIAQKRELAKQLYLNTDLTLKEIAERVGVTANTIGKWCASWKQIKAAKTSTRDEIIARYMRMIGNILKEAEDEGRAITDSEADKISKLNKAKDSIDKEVGLVMFIQIFQEYNSWLIPINAELAKENNTFQTKFINIKAIGE